MHWIETAVFLGLVFGLAGPVGRYLARVFERRPTFFDAIGLPVERVLLRFLGVRPGDEMTATTYAACFAAFTAAGSVLVFALQMAQSALPGGPADAALATPMTADLAANTAVSFATTTTWQAYGGETTLKHLVQVVGLVSQNFLGAAAGLAVGVAFARGFARERAATLGNFWVDVVRGLVWVLLPLAFVLSLALVAEGVPLTWGENPTARTVEGADQTIAVGPAAVLEGVKNLGTNGGGFFNANGAHPLANPTPLTNLLGLLAIAVLPAGVPVMFGHLVGRPRAGWVLLAVMGVLYVGGLVALDIAERADPPWAAAAGVTGGNMEGKEVRFGVGGSARAAAVTSNGACGSNASMHGSFHPLGVLVLFANMALGEVALGGLGSGLYSLLMAALIGVFLGGMMVGRTPEYLGKTLAAGEAKLVAVYALLGPGVILACTGVAAVTAAGRAGPAVNTGPRAMTEILFAYTSCFANNGQALAGFNANAAFYNLTTLVPMVAGRVGLGWLALALAGRLAAQGRRTETAGTLRPDTATFGVLVLGAVLLLGGLCFLPAAALGPVADHLRP